MKRIYIVLIKAHTGLGRFARLFGGFEYTHTAICFDKNFDDFLSFSRKRHYLPFDAGFMHEYRDFYAFGKHKRFKAKAFELAVDEKHYADIERFIFECQADKDMRFNLFSMLTMPIIGGFEIYKAHNCMSFVSKVIKFCGTVKMSRPYYRYSIKDIDRLLCSYVCFEGYLLRKESPHYNKYMQKPSFFEYIAAPADLIFTLIKRMI